MSRTSLLDVWLEGEPAPIGELRRGPGLSVAFAYRSSAAPPVSVRLLPREEPYDDRTSRAFFDNLLPEGEPRAAIAAQHRIDTGDVFGLLSVIGAEAPGAVSVLPAGSPPAKSPGILDRDYEAMSKAELANTVRAVAAGRAPGQALRFSLAGVQAKFALAIDGNRYLKPRQGAPTTHILKVERADGRSRGIVANEFLCLQLFRRLGLETVETRREIISGVPVLVVTRYDRTREAGGVIRRLHQEDAAQVHGLDRTLKYQADAEKAGLKAGFAELFGVFAAACSPAMDARDAILHAAFLHWLLGNSDAHWKNWAARYQARTVPVPDLPNRPLLRLAPFYDVVCVAVIDDVSHDLAMRIGPTESWDSVSREDWERLVGYAVGMRSRAAVGRALDRLRSLAGRILPALDTIVDEGLVSWQEAKPIRDVVGSRLRHLNSTLGWDVTALTDAAIIRGGGWTLS